MRCIGHRTTGAGTLPTGADTTFGAVARAVPVRCRRNAECCRRDTECAPGWPRRRGQVPQGRRLRHAGCTTRPGKSGGHSTMARPPRSRPRDNGGCTLRRQDGIGQAHEALRRPSRAMVGWATMDDSADAGRWAQGSVLVGGLPLRWSAAPCLATEIPVRSAIPADVACSWRTGGAAVESGTAEGHAHQSTTMGWSCILANRHVEEKSGDAAPVHLENTALDLPALRREPTGEVLGSVNRCRPSGAGFGCRATLDPYSGWPVGPLARWPVAVQAHLAHISKVACRTPWDVARGTMWSEYHHVDQAR